MASDHGTRGFAMGTVAGANTRRHHGLLVASLHPPVDRYVLLSKLERGWLGRVGEIYDGGRAASGGGDAGPGLERGGSAGDAPDFLFE